MSQHYARKRRQLKHAAKLAQRAIEQANGHLRIEAQRLLLKVHRIVAQMRHRCSKRVIRRALGGLLLLGATESQVNAQSFAPVQPNQFGLIQQSMETVSLTNVEFVDLDNDGDLDFLGLNFPLIDNAGVYDGANIIFQENIGSLTAASFGPFETNPFGFNGGTLEGWDQSELLTGVDLDVVDLDQDGDFDILGSFQYGSAYNYNSYDYTYLQNAMFWVENTGTPEAPQFGNVELNPFGLDVSGFGSNKDSEAYAYAFDCVDIDGDGDIDFLGTLTDYSIPDNAAHQIYWCENIGSAMNPSFAPPALEPFGLLPSEGGNLYPGLSFSVEAVDLDQDGDIDLLQSLYFDGPVTAYSVCQFFENIGNAVEPSFAAPLDNPFGLQAGMDLPNNNAGVRTIQFSDLDGDGDLDFLANNIFGYGSYDGYTPEYQENISPVDVSEMNGLSLEIYPNPATTSIRFNWGELAAFAVTISDASGVQVMQCNSACKEANIEHLAKGLYLLSVDTELGEFTRKFIKN